MRVWESTLWIYLNVADTYVAWEVYRGNLLSSTSGPRPEGWSPISLILASSIRRGDSGRLQHELWMERIRSVEFPEAVSRLRAMYYFPDEPSADRAAREWEDRPAHFVPECLAEVGFETAPRSSRHDSNWIDESMFLARPFTEADDPWIRKYWSGETSEGREPLWEVLIEGGGWVFGTGVRERAYSTIAANQPASLAILELARVAAELGSMLGHCAPLVTRTAQDRCSLRHLMDFRDATDDAFLTRLHGYEGPKNLADLNAKILEQQGLTTPDFMDEAFDFSVPPDLSSLFQTVR